MPLFEIVRTGKTSNQCIVDTLGLSKQIKKTPVVVGNCTGFAVNRVFFPYTMSAFLLVDAGLDLYRLDAIIKEQFGMPMGPFRLSDLVGGDVGMHVGANFVVRGEVGTPPPRRQRRLGLLASLTHVFVLRLSSPPVPHPCPCPCPFSSHCIQADFPDRVYPTNLLPNMCAAKRMGAPAEGTFTQSTHPICHPTSLVFPPASQLNHHSRPKAHHAPGHGPPLLLYSVISFFRSHLTTSIPPAGEKTGAGFYKYDAKRKASPDPEGVAPFLQASRGSTGGRLPPAGAFTDAEIMEAVFFPVVNEGCRVLGEGIVAKAGDLDVAAVMGMGFPPFRGGLMHWADSVGAKRIHARLAELERMYGGLYRPCEYLAQCATKGVPLSVGPNGQAAKL